MASDDVNFLDLVVVQSIPDNMVLEKLGGILNASIFDAYNLAGSLKQKGLIDFSATFPGPTSVNVTDAGKALIAEAAQKSAEPFDDLDQAVLNQLSGGKRMPVDLQNTLNLRAKDLALRVNKLNKQGFVTYELKNGGATIMLTEQGFLKAKPVAKMVAPQPGMPAQPGANPMQGGEQSADGDAAKKQPIWKNTNFLFPVIFVIAAVVVVYVILHFVKHVI